MDFTVYSFIHERNEPYVPLPSQLNVVLICRLRVDGRLSVGTSTVSKQSDLNRYVADIAVVSCSNRHASLVM